MKAHYILVAGAFAFVIALAVVVGFRMSSEAMAVVVGVIAGVAASIPTSLIVVWLALRAQAAAAPPTPREPQEPRIIIVNAAPPAPAAQPLLSPPSRMNPYAGVPQPPRQFTVIGGIDESAGG